jgi:hypothetical protein
MNVWFALLTMSKMYNVENVCQHQQAPPSVLSLLISTNELVTTMYSSLLMIAANRRMQCEILHQTNHPQICSQLPYLPVPRALFFPLLHQNLPLRLPRLSRLFPHFFPLFA